MFSGQDPKEKINDVNATATLEGIVYMAWCPEMPFILPLAAGHANASKLLQICEVGCLSTSAWHLCVVV